MTEGNPKDTLKSIHSTAVNKAVAKQKKNRVLDDLPPPISNNEVNLPKRQRTTLSQLRSGNCKLLGPYKKRIGKDATDC